MHNFYTYLVVQWGWSDGCLHQPLFWPLLGRPDNLLALFSSRLLFNIIADHHRTMCCAFCGLDVRFHVLVVGATHRQDGPIVSRSQSSRLWHSVKDIQNPAQGCCILVISTRWSEFGSLLRAREVILDWTHPGGANLEVLGVAHFQMSAVHLILICS